MLNFWQKLEKPFFCLAPMSDVTDVAFRYILAKYGKNRENKNKIVFWTEFVSADGLCDKFGRKKLSHILKYSESERPIVAQVFGANPDNMKKACQYIASLGFDGIDINMGCPDKSVISQGAGSALIKTPELSRKIIRAAIEGWNEVKMGVPVPELLDVKSEGLVSASKLPSKSAAGSPISVKTRIGFNKEEIDSWIPELLKEDIAALTIHLRTTKELSLVKANWNHIKKIKELIKKSGKEILLIGNGDIKDLKDAEEKALKYGCDGVMIGRGVFGNPWFFSGNENETASKETWERDGASTRNFLVKKYPCSFEAVSFENKLKVLVEHTQIFEKELSKPKHKSFAVMKKHFKAYVNGFEGAKELRVKLMETENAKQVENIIKKFLLTKN